MITKRRLIIFIRLVVSITLLSILAYKYGKSAYQELSSIQRPWFLGLAIVLHFSEKLLRIHNLSRLLKFHHVEVAYWKLVQITWISSFFGFFIPSSSGPDLVRIFHLKKYSDNFSKPTSATLTLNLASIFGAAAVALTGIALVRFFGYQAKIEVFSGLAILCLLILIGFFVIFSKGANRMGLKVMEFKIWRVLGPVRDFLREILLDTRDYLKLGNLFATVLIASSVMILASVKIFTLSQCVRMDFSLLYFITFVPTVAIVTTLPISFAGIGLRESAFVFLFASVGANDEKSFSVGLLATALNLVVIFIGGLLCLLELKTGVGEKSAIGLRAK